MKILLPLAALFMAMLLTSCASQSVYLQNLTVEGPQVQAPLFITKDNKAGEFRVVPRFAINTGQTLVGRATGHSNVNAQGVHQVDTVISNGVTTYIERNNANTKTFQGRNFLWTPTKWSASLDFEYLATDMIALVGGVNYSSTTTQGFLGANFGAGFLFEGKYVAVRVDLGAHVSSVAYDVSYIVPNPPLALGPREREVQFFREKRKATEANGYGAFTINSIADHWPLQFFTQLTINRQTIVHIDKRVPNAAESTVLQSVSYFIITPGLYFDLSPKSRMLVGVNLRDETELLEADPGVLISPFVQFEFGL